MCELAYRKGMSVCMCVGGKSMMILMDTCM